MNYQQVLKEYTENPGSTFFGRIDVSVNMKDGDGDTPLHYACWRCAEQEALALIRGGADLAAVGDMGRHPIHVAVLQGDTGIVRLLLENGSPLDRWDDFKQTPIMIAEEKGYRDIFHLLQKASSTESRGS